MGTRAAVTIWCWPLSAQAPIDRLTAMISADEIGRAKAMRIAGHGERFIVAHAGVRSILGRELGRGPLDLQFGSGPHGKPELGDCGDLRFNLSHSHDFAVLAVCRGFEIGVDVEMVRHLDDVEHIADRFFAECESKAVACASGDLQDRLFLRFWTCKEAYLKATGEGLSRPFDEAVVALASDGAVEGMRDASGAPIAVSIKTFDPAPGYVGALAAPADEVRMRLEEWRF
jgi:4'-phosphopantetheinyl transferase